MKRHTILFLAANPSETDPLVLDREAREIQVELERSRWRDRFELVTRWAAEPLDLLRELRRLAPTVVQFSGHSSAGMPEVTPKGPRWNRDVVTDLGPPEAAPCRGLFFHGADGRPRVVSAGALRDVFGVAGSSVKLVILNACYSEPAADALLAHVDCVVGMAGSIGDHAARSFAVGFYGGLGERASIEAAYRGGCAAIGLEGYPDGALPRLKVRCGTNAGQLILAALTPMEPRGDMEAQPPPGARAVTAGDLGVAPTGPLAALLPARPAPRRARAIASGLVATAAIAGVVYATRSVGGPSAASVGDPAAKVDVSAQPGPPPVPAGMVRIEGATIALGLDDAALAKIVPGCPRGHAGCNAAAALWRATSVPDVQISPFTLDVTEVTAADFAAWLTANRASLTIRDGAAFDTKGPLAVIAPDDVAPAQRRVLPLQLGPGNAITAVPGRERAPMTMVTWLGAQEYCISRGAQLPTEAEWELAARGPHGAADPWGDVAPTCSGIVFGRAVDRSWGLPRGPCVAVGTPEAPELVDLGAATIDRNPAGVLGLAGNVREWVLDSFDASEPGYPACQAPCKDPWAEVPGKPFTARRVDAWLSEPRLDHVIRGCSFLDPALRCHGAARGYNNGYASVASADPRVGFRCAKRLAR